MSGRLSLLAALLFSATVMAAPTQKDEVALLINQRLSFMKDVAGYKAVNHLPIEDLTQEAKVLTGSLADAENLGLDGESVKPFIQAQMDAAKAIQYRYRAGWLSVPENQWRPQPLEQARARIGALNLAILDAISIKLTQGEVVTDKKAFMQALNQTYLIDADKERLWYSLEKITLKKKTCQATGPRKFKV
ncbi:chorismate mutase [Acerihabitans sp. KWT182]|uniref:Chorismate mutase n=1 Tax=Acerihabitans sp. KWT182 TaxID=3157919 RepID=A0AAU7QET2_9GAMM